MHRRDIIDEIGYWQRPREVYSFPRADYFRKAQFIGKKFVLAPMMMVVKFFVYGKDYSKATIQPQVMEQIKSDPDFVNRQMSKMLAYAWHEHEKSVSLRRIASGWSYGLKRWMVKRKMDPARLKFWKRPGKMMREWRRNFALDPTVIRGKK